MAQIICVFNLFDDYDEHRIECFGVKLDTKLH